MLCYSVIPVLMSLPELASPQSSATIRRPCTPRRTPNQPNPTRGQSIRVLDHQRAPQVLRQQGCQRQVGVVHPEATSLKIKITLTKKRGSLAHLAVCFESTDGRSELRHAEHRSRDATARRRRLSTSVDPTASHRRPAAAQTQGTHRRAARPSSLPPSRRRADVAVLFVQGQRTCSRAPLAELSPRLPTELIQGSHLANAWHRLDRLPHQRQPGLIVNVALTKPS